MDFQSPLPDMNALARRLDRLEARAGEKHRDHLRLGSRIRELDAFLDLAPKAADTLQELSKALFGELLDEIETNLTHGLMEILGQDREVRTIRQVKNNRLFVDFVIMNQGQEENVLAGTGGSVCNILSVGLRLIALSQLDEDKHRPFLVLDEQDCWLKPSLVPKFIKLISRICKRLGLQALVISHHPIDIFAGDAETIYALAPDKENGVVLDVIKGGEEYMLRVI